MYTAYLDMDGPLVGFEKGYYEGTGRTKGFDKTEFREFVLSGGFKTLPESKRFHEIFDVVRYYQDQVEFKILSSCGSADDHNFARLVAEQKLLWLDNHGLGDLKSVFVVHKGLKKHFASPTAILLDDTHQNIWDFNEYHGIGIHYTDDNDSVDKLINKCSEVMNVKDIVYAI